MIRRLAVVLGLVATLAAAVAVPASAQVLPIQQEIIDGVLTNGFWADNGQLDATEMEPIVAEWGDEFAFAITDRALEVQDEAGRNAAALLAQSTLESMVAAGGPDTLFLVTDSEVGAASTRRPFLNIMTALENFDRSNPEASFAEAAAAAVALGDVVVPVEPAQTSFFGDWRIFLLLGIVTAMLALASLRSSRKKRARRVHTAGARDDTKAQLQAMSELILDLDPRVTIANDPELKERYVDASDTYREVLEKAQEADTGHEVADLRIAISKARWKLDVIDAELEGRTPPSEPHTRNTSGSAWDSTRGTGAGP